MAKATTTARPTTRAVPGRITTANLEMWPSEWQLWVDGQRVWLTKTEGHLLGLLMANERHVITREELYDHVWGGPLPHRDRKLDVYVRKLRHKLAEAAPGWTYLHTHHAMGYRFEPVAPDDQEAAQGGQREAP